MAKPSLSELKALIDIVLDSVDPNTAVYLNRNTADSAYAGYVFALVLRAVERIADPNSVSLNSAQSGPQNPPPPSVFVIRGAPGALYSKDQDYGFAVFKHKGKDYEIHLGVQYRGSSEVLHEFDISIVPKKDANESRKSNKPPGF